MKGQLILNISIAKGAIKEVDSLIKQRELTELKYTTSRRGRLILVAITALILGLCIKSLPSVDTGDGNTFTQIDLLLTYVLVLFLIFFVSKARKKKRLKNIDKEINESRQNAEQYMSYVKDDTIESIPYCFRNYKALDGIEHYLSIDRAANLKEAIELYDKERYDADRRENKQQTEKYNLTDDPVGCGCLAALAGLTLFEWIGRLINRM